LDIFFVHFLKPEILFRKKVQHGGPCPHPPEKKTRILGIDFSVGARGHEQGEG
jgi:hypothetical protein